MSLLLKKAELLIILRLLSLARRHIHGRYDKMRDGNIFLQPSGGNSIMQEAVLPQFASWETFYVIIGTAAATLTGLMFVVATLVATVRKSVSSPAEAFAAFNTPSVVHFGAALLIAALLSAPWQAIWYVSLLLALVGLAGMSYVVIIIRRARRQHDYQPVLEDWLWHTIF